MNELDARPTAPAATAPLGTPETPSGDVGAGADGDSGSLSDHEASFSPEAQRTPQASDDDDAARDARGQFKPRRRAASQQADADDVPTINALTARLRSLEETHGKDIVRKQGESERVYNLRRRAELLERQSSPAPAPPTAQPPQSRQAPALAQTFPAYEAFIALDGNEDKTYDDYTDARAEWRFAVLRQSERAQEAAERAQRDFQQSATTHHGRVAQAKAKYADWDTVVTSDLPISRVIHDAVLGSANSAEVQYFLGAHRDILAQLVAETQDFHPSAVAPMRRLLDSFVAEQRSDSPSRTAAGSTGAAPARVSTPAPRPPTPVRTGSIAAPDTPPDDSDMSISSHEKRFGGGRR